MSVSRVPSIGEAVLWFRDGKPNGDRWDQAQGGYVAIVMNQGFDSLKLAIFSPSDRLYQVVDGVRHISWTPKKEVETPFPNGAWDYTPAGKRALFIEQQLISIGNSLHVNFDYEREKKRQSEEADRSKAKEAAKG